MQERHATTVLVVEDEPSIRTLLAAVLSGAGYQVATAADGVGAIDYLDGNPAPGVILLDWLMPGMGGLEFLQRREESPSMRGIPVVVLSGHLGGSDSSALVAHGVGYCAKPFKTKELLR